MNCSSIYFCFIHHSACCPEVAYFTFLIRSWHFLVQLGSVARELVFHWRTQETRYANCECHSMILTNTFHVGLIGLISTPTYMFSIPSLLTYLPILTEPLPRVSIL
ncbi:hypothetical protein L873DRAFT_473889 [Choiromyces venosus 120613-1]|uniref:Uncharacterized protein n=1 Tax=Choiromyces venosus 120613-1 TaxID=1336337 RepID=A0A3N4J194_9PEZI|nr:hypothetical protein L873DRAFT_473889 [Choiromyces venosus 120613-1]